MSKTLVAKRLAKTKKISVREAEWWLDASAYLEEQQQWAPSGLHHEYLHQQIFSCTATTSQSEYNHAICWGWREPLPE